MCILENCPYIQSTMAQSKRSIEENGQWRLAAITDLHKSHISNLRHTSLFFNWGVSTHTSLASPWLLCLSLIIDVSNWSELVCIFCNARNELIDFSTISGIYTLMCISPIYSNKPSLFQTVDEIKRTTAFGSHHKASRKPHLKYASHFTVSSQLVRLPH